MHWAALRCPPHEPGGEKGTNTNVKLMLFAVLVVIKLFISDLGVLFFLPASMKLKQANFLACKLSKIPNPAGSLTVIFEVSLEAHADLLDEEK